MTLLRIALGFCLPRRGSACAGDPEREVHTRYAVAPVDRSCRCADSGADAYVTSDLRHHIAAEAVTERGADAMALVDAAHWATESPWLDVLAARLRAKFGEQGAGLKVAVSAQVTDPWTLHFPSRG